MNTPSATVLVVDDVPANLGLLFDSLSQAGYRVLVAESGESALAQVAHEMPDLILLDYRLPGMDGLAVCRTLRARPEAADLPILFLTAVDDVREKVRVFEAGAVDYVTKPIEPSEVLARVRTHLRLARLQRELVDELELRRDAEEQLRQSLDRAFVVVDERGRIRFSTRLASTLLARLFPGASREVLPPAVAATLTGSGVEPLPGGLEVRVLRLPGDSELGVVELVGKRSVGPADLLVLGLTPREAEVLYWLSEGKTNGETATILGSSRRTVEKHVEHLLEKLGVENRAAAIRTALKVLEG